MTVVYIALLSYIYTCTFIKKKEEKIRTKRMEEEEDGKQVCQATGFLYSSTPSCHFPECFASNHLGTERPDLAERIP